MREVQLPQQKFSKANGKTSNPLSILTWNYSLRNGKPKISTYKKHQHKQYLHVYFKRFT